jgi:hypothetical protein
MRPACARGLLLAALVVVGCGQLDDRQRFEPVVGALQIVETIPAAGAQADPLARIDVCLSAEVDPRALESYDATLHSGALTFDTEVEVQLFSWLAPGSRTELSVERWCPGSVISLTPGIAMHPGLDYRIRLRPALLGWAGESLDTEQDGWLIDGEGEEAELLWFLEFRISGSSADVPPEDVPELEPGPTLTELFAPGEVFDPERGACSCHQGNDELASARLNLSDPQTAWTELVLRTGLEATDFPMITTRRPSESYLLHKLLRTSDGEPLHALHGEPMPPDEPLPHADVVRIAHWIQSGAEL